MDGSKSFPEAIEAVYLIRYSLSYVSHKDRKQVATDLKAIYQAATLEEAEDQLT